MDELTTEVLDAITRRDWATLKPLLHPYLHWTDGRTRLRGRKNVLAHLENTPTPAPPAGVETRDGQVYRWIGRPAAESE